MHDNDLCVIGTATRGLTLAAPISLSIDARRRHIHAIGKTGTGKSTLLKTLIFDDLRTHRGVAVLDPLGGLAEAVVDAVPIERTNQAVFFDPSDLAHPIGFNPLDRVPPDHRHLVADHIVASFMHIWGASLEGAPRLTFVLYNSIRLLLDNPGSTLLGLPRLLIDDAYRGRLIESCQDPLVMAFWCNEFASYDDRFRVQVIAPIQNKIGMLLAGPIANILGQRRSTIDIARLMNEGGILIAALGKGRVGAIGSHLIGALLTTTISRIADERSSQPNTSWNDFTLYADEVQNFATERFSSAISEGRNGHLSLVLAHQFLHQLPAALQHAIIANCGSFIVFRIGAYDAEIMSSELGIKNSEALSDTQNFSAWVKLLRDGNPTEAFLLKTHLPDPPASGRKNAVVNHTRARHSRERGQIESSIARQMHE